MVVCCVCVCFFYSKMSPNRVFDNALALVREDSQVRRRFGEPIKGYGRDHGGHREGRRNFIEYVLLFCFLFRSVCLIYLFIYFSTGMLNPYFRVNRYLQTHGTCRS